MGLRDFVKPEGNTLVLMHPYYIHSKFEIPYKFDLETEVNRRTKKNILTDPFVVMMKEKEIPFVQYANELNNILKTHKWHLIIFESQEELENTKFRQVQVGRSDQTYFIVTKNGHSAPKNTDWNHALKFLEQFSQVTLAGGYYTPESDLFGKGCLGRFEDELIKEKIDYNISDAVYG